MPLVTCPNCGSDDIGSVGHGAGGSILLRCDVCATEWSREPRAVCPRCGSDDVVSRAYEGWAYDDIEEARESAEGGTWSYIDREAFHCRKCQMNWRRSGEARPYQPPD